MFCRLFCILSFLLAATTHAATPAWQSTLTRDAPGNVPPPRPLHANYVFGWSGLTAATAAVEVNRPSDSRVQLEGVGHTVGLARALWKYNVDYRSLAESETLRPLEANQDETTRSKHMVTHLTFSSTGVTRARAEGSGPDATKSRQYPMPNLYDLFSASLFLRSQPLKEKASYKVAVYPASNAYVATITVLNREKISVRAGSYNAIKMDLQLSRVSKTNELEPHKKFRRASIWVSDDADRMILRAEAQIFIGTVFAELQSVKFDTPKS